jgi:hypothetical protein
MGEMIAIIVMVLFYFFLITILFYFVFLSIKSFIHKKKVNYFIISVIIFILIVFGQSIWYLLANTVNAICRLIIYLFEAIINMLIYIKNLFF